MSDRLYSERASRQRRLIILLGIIVLIGICGLIFSRTTFFDPCTNSFDRRVESVVTSYVQAIQGRDFNRIQSCWERDAYFALDSGCSEICLKNSAGTAYHVDHVEMGLPFSSEGGRSGLQAVITVSCPNGKEMTGEMMLDTLAGAIPWKHWRVVHSSVGGTLSEPWCK